MLKCDGGLCPLKERCYRYYADYTFGKINGIPYKGGLCEYFTTKNDYESRTNKRGKGGAQQ